MSRVGVVVALLALTGSAPFQCTRDPDPDKVREEEPGEALYRLAQRFRDEGNQGAWKTTLEHLVDRYPASRFATTASDDLEAGFGATGAAKPDE